MADQGVWEDVEDPNELNAYAAQVRADRARKSGKVAPEDPHGDVMETAHDRDQARAVLARIQQIEPQLARSEQLFNRNFGQAGIGSVAEYLPGYLSPTNAQYDQANGELQKLVKNAMYVPGTGHQTDFSSQLALKALPDRHNNDAANREAYKALHQYIDSNKEVYARQLGLPSAPPPRNNGRRQPTREITIDAHGNIIR